MGFPLGIPERVALQKTAKPSLHDILLFFLDDCKQVCITTKNKSPIRGFAVFCGEEGIRTPETLRFTCFPSRPVQPLLHLSGYSLGLRK